MSVLSPSFFHLPLHSDGHQRPDGDKDGDVLHGVHHRTPAGRPDPPPQDEVGVGERNAEGGHADVGEGEIAQEVAQVARGPPSQGEHQNGHQVAAQGEEGGQGVERLEKVLTGLAHQLELLDLVADAAGEEAKVVGGGSGGGGGDF